MEVIHDMGMTDLQFKSWLKQIIRGLEGAKEEATKEDTDNGEGKENSHSSI